MTSTVTEVTKRFIELQAGDAITNGAGLVAVLLLIALLVEKELLRAVSAPWTRIAIWAFNCMIVPLLLTFARIVVAHLVAALR